VYLPSLSPPPSKISLPNPLNSFTTQLRILFPCHPHLCFLSLPIPTNFCLTLHVLSSPIIQPPSPAQLASLHLIIILVTPTLILMLPEGRYCLMTRKSVSLTQKNPLV